jgi:hypothetical protein
MYFNIDQILSIKYLKKFDWKRWRLFS